MSIVIPVRGSANTVEVFNDELPDDPADVIDLLRAELAPLNTWCEFAVAYYEQGRHEQFREILLGVVDAFDVYEMQDFYRREPALFTSGRLRVLNLLAASATSSFIYEELRKDAREALTHTHTHTLPPYPMMIAPQSPPCQSKSADIFYRPGDRRRSNILGEPTKFQQIVHRHGL